jgi:integrase/recombinase XerD
LFSQEKPETQVYLHFPLASENLPTYTERYISLERFCSMAGQAAILKDKDIQNIFQVIPNPRNKLLFAIGIYTGLRIGEIVRLETDQVLTENGTVRNKLTVKRLKKRGTVYSDIPIHPKLRSYIREYALSTTLGTFLFPSQRSASGHIERVQAHYIVRSAFDALRLDGTSTHSMRRTFLTTLSRMGVPLRTVQEMSGHSSLSQLQAYLAVDPEDTRDAVHRLKY